MGRSWTLWLDLAGRPGWQNMAMDQALLERAASGERWLRLYRWAPHCLSFGRHEPAVRRYDRERVATLGLDVVRRPTGGRAVWHAEELTYAVATPHALLGGLRAAYEEIHRMLLDALRRLGARGELAPRAPTPALGSGACFASPVGGEVVIAGRKVVGSAQLREGDAMLQHGSILLQGSQDVVRTVTRDEVRTVTRDEVPRDLAGPIAGALGRPPAIEEAAEAVATAAAGRWGGSWEPVSSPRDLIADSRRHEVRFRSPDWTWSA
jgi:lipoate-protein ligase A